MQIFTAINYYSCSGVVLAGVSAMFLHFFVYLRLKLSARPLAILTIIRVS